MCCNVVLKCILIIVNIVAMLAGIALLIVGAILQWGQNFMVNVMGPLLGSLLGGMQTVQGVNYNSNGFQLSDLKSILGQFGTYLGYSGIVMVILGGVLALLAILGIIGAAKTNACCLIIYIIPVSIIAAIFIVVFFYWIANQQQLHDLGAAEFKKTILNGYRGFNSTDPGSQLINLFNARLECCGVSGYGDFLNISTSVWTRTETYQNSTTNGTTTQNVVIPVSCCQMTAQFTFIPENPQCPLSYNSTDSNANTGCYDKLWTLMSQYSVYTSLTFVGLAIIMIILVCMTATLINSARQKSSKSI